MNRWFRNTSIRNKLLIISGFVTIVVLALSTALLMASLWFSEREAAVNELEGIAALMGANNAAALVFDDTDAAQEALQTLATYPGIQLGVLYDAEGREFARFEKGDQSTPSLSLLASNSGTVVDGYEVTTLKPVTLDGEAVGAILLQSTLYDRLMELGNALAPVALILLATFAIAIIISQRLTRFVTSPLAELSRLVQRVTREDDYNLRSTITRNDEVGLLSNGVNAMLERIQHRDAEIRQHHQHLEELVAERTSRLEEANHQVKAELAELERAERQLKQAHDTLEKHHKSFSLLSEMNDRLQVCHDVKEISPVVRHYLPRLFPDSSGNLLVINHSRSLVEVHAEWGLHANSEKIFQPDDCWALRQGRLHVVEDPDSGLICNHCRSDNIREYVCAPMIAYGEVLGVLHVSGLRENSLSAGDRQIILSAAEHLALAVANLRLRDALQMRSVRDPLTGLFNRRYLQESLEREVARSVRSSLPTCVLMLDIDHFKRFNDTHGHEAGDIVLREFGALLMNSVRTEDIACRYGGEEFTIVMPGADAETALDRAEQIRDGISRLSLVHKGESLPSIHVSIGVSMAPDNGIDVDDLIEAADKALYFAKRHGRNQVRLAPPDPER